MRAFLPPVLLSNCVWNQTLTALATETTATAHGPWTASSTPLAWRQKQLYYKMFASRLEDTSVASTDYTCLNVTIFCSVWTIYGAGQSLAISKLVHTLSYGFKGANIFLHPEKPMARAGWSGTLMSYGNIFPKQGEREVKCWYQFAACGLRWSADCERPYLCNLSCTNFLTKAHHARCNTATVLYLRVPPFLIERTS